MKTKRLVIVIIIITIVIGSAILGTFLIINQGPKLNFYENNLPEGGMVNIGLSIQTSTSITDELLEIVNNEYGSVIIATLNQQIRDWVVKPQLFLYRSIQGTWSNFNQFDWSHIDSHENMFCHHNGERIKTIYDSWLMAGTDMVEPNSSDALEHWINYYAVTASQQVNSYDYDGLFIDSAAHFVNPYVVSDKMPDNYDEEEWRQARIEALAYIKSQLLNKTVIFNGLHGGHGSEESINNTDGGMWETFAFNTQNGKYKGKDSWLKAIELTEQYKNNSFISLVAKKDRMTADIASRMFVTASYFLVWSENVFLGLVDMKINSNGEFVYYPEYRINLGNPLGSYSMNDGVYFREFEDGIVIVNPSEDETLTFLLNSSYEKIIPFGGGLIRMDGRWEGSLSYEDISGSIELAPTTGLILLKK